MDPKKLQREEAILLSLKKLDYLTRSQIQKLHELGKERNARRVLEGMDSVSSFRLETGENVYYLNKLGRERVNSEVARQKSNQVNHFLMRNDVYIHYKAQDWKTEVLLKADKKDGDTVASNIADAYFMHNFKRHILEVDHLQHMHKNKEKIDKYKKINDTGIFQTSLKYFPSLVWVTLTDSRKKQLLEWCEGLEVAVHLWDEIK